MEARVDRHGLKVASTLDRFVAEEALPATGIDADSFWRGFSDIVREFAPPFVGPSKRISRIEVNYQSC